MTDNLKDLLTLAAKACGMEIGYGDGQYFFSEHGPFGSGMYGKHGKTEMLRWHPHRDVGEAARVLLKLQLSLGYVDGQPCVSGVLKSGMTAEESFCLAVVHAAAQIGKGMT